MKLLASHRLQADAGTFDSDVDKLQKAFRGLGAGNPTKKVQGDRTSATFKLNAGTLTYVNHGDSCEILLQLPGHGLSMGEGATLSKALFEMTSDLGKAHDFLMKQIRSKEAELHEQKAAAGYMDNIKQAAAKAGS